MFNLLKKITLGFVALFSVQAGYALEINTTNYETYIGDVDGDGDGDYYFKQKPWTLILHGDIATPLVLKGTKNFVVYNNAGVLSAPQSFMLADADLATKVGSGALKLAQLNTDIFQMAASSGQNTLLIRGANTSTPALLLQSFSNSDLPTVLKVYEPNQFVGISDRNVALKIADINGDGYNDIVLGNTTSGETAYLAQGGAAIPERYFEVSPSIAKPVADATHVGTTAGQFRVDESGAATYSIPINVPDGIAGVKPQISLNYSSNGGNGIAGRGWSLGGLSAISRCRQTLSQDNNPQPITWSVNDRFCLDGQRLILTSGTYGSIGSTYKTEIDSVIEVKAVGGSAGHPDSFEVKAKDGSLTIYGRNSVTNAKLFGSTANSATTILTWAISRFQDNMGNAIEFEYDGDSATGQRIKNIYYAYSSISSSLRRESGAQARVEFLYGNRNDSSSAYVAGYAFGQTQKLNQIKVYNSSTNTPVLSELRAYNLNYLPNTLANINDNRGIKDITRLASVQECRGSACYAPIQFNWGGGTKIIFESSIASFSVSHIHDNKVILQKVFADVSGDGRQDLIYVVHEKALNSSGKAEVSVIMRYADNGAPNTVTYVRKYTVNKYQDIRLQNIDYNLDGRQDIVFYDGAKWWLHKAELVSPNTIWQLSNPIDLNITDSKILFADVTSDGMVDAVTSTGYRPLAKDPAQVLTSSTYYKFASNVSLALHPNNQYTEADAFPVPEICSLSSSNITIKNDTMSDFNGDGVVDFVGNYSRIYNCYDEPVVGQGTYFNLVRNYYYPFVVSNNQLVKYANALYVQGDVGEPPIRMMDLNGDGLTDVVLNQGSNYQYQLNTGSGFTAATNWYALPTYAVNPKDTIPQFIDYNGDGLMDLFWYDRTQGKVRTLLWNTTTPVDIASVPSGQEYMLADVSGDGVQDLVVLASNRISASYGQYATESGQMVCTNYDSVESGECLSWAPTNIPESQTRQNLSITAIANGTGSVTNIHYGTLSNSGRYATMDVDPNINVSGSPQQCYTNAETGYTAYCSGGYTYTFDLNKFYSRLNGGWDLPTDSFTLVPGNSSKGAPVLEVNGSMMIVTAVESNTPAAGSSAYNIDQQAMSKVDYYYGEAKMQASGRGFLGFGKLTTVDAQTDVKTVSFYRQDFPFIGSPLSTTVYSNSTANAKILSHSYNKWNFKEKLDGNTNQNAFRTKYYLPYLEESTEKTFDADNAANLVLQTVTTTNVYDNFANLTKAISTTSGSGITLKQTVTNEYGTPDVTDFNNQYGRLTKAEVKTQRNLEEEKIKVSTFDYEQTGSKKGLLKKEEIVGGPKTEYTYDNFGNKIKISVTATNSLDVLETRNTFNSYSTDGRYLVSTSNDLSQSAQITSRNEYGQPVSATDANSVSSGETYYDAMGNQYMQKNADGSWSRTESRWCNSANGISCPAGAVYRIYSRASGGSKAYEYFDKLGRSIRSSKLGFSGNQWNIVDTEYDNLSRVKRQSNPFTSADPHTGTTTVWTITEFDNFGRPTKITTPDNAESSLSYSGYSTTSKNALNQTKIETKNGLGQLIKVEDALQGIIEYEYDVYGGLLKATTTAKNVNNQTQSISVRMCYDDLGRKTAMLDPDKGGAYAASGDATVACNPTVTYQRAGWWTYKYNGFGELMEQADPKGQRTQMHYDKLGRMVGRVDVKANGSIESFTQWFYEKGVNAQSTGLNGKLTAVVMNSATNITQSQINTALTNGTASCVEGNACFKTIYEFDGLTRPQNTKTYYPGSSTAYTSWVYYDVFGRAFKQFDPLDQQLTENGTKVNSGTQTSFNDFGYVSAVRDIGSGQLISSVQAMNARGQITYETRGNGALTENGYDNLTGQLTSQKAYIYPIKSIQDISYKWDKIGNLKYRKNNSPFIGGSGNKNKQESFCYDSLNRLVKTVGNVSADYASNNSACSSPDMVYDGFGNIKTKNGVAYQYGTNAGPHAATNIGGVTYTYDANGNAISGDGRTFDYTSYDMAAKISKSSTNYTEFKYGPDRARWYREDVKSGSAIIKTTYIGNVEKIETVGGDIEWKRYVGGAIFTYKTNTTNQVQSKDKSWVYNDHLGSVDVITDNTGTIRQSLSFTPWGERRSGENWSAMTAAQITAALVPSGYSRPITTRGYTGHEMVDDMGIIHMNGRIYDAKIARFLQADPFIQAAGDTQSYNRYSYVRNNPLNKIDPSGYFFSDLKKAWNKIRPFVGMIVAVVLTVFAPAGAGFWYATFVGAASGAAGAAANGGNILRGALTGAVSAAAFYGVGKYFSKLGGQSCRPGTYNFGGNYLTPGEIAGQITSHAMVGGVLAELQGGKFGHGFASAGFTKGVTGSGITEMGTGPAAIAGETFMAAVVGGTVSEITGGKFASGAQTAAFAYLFNQTMSELRTMAAYRSMANQHRASQAQMNRYAPISRVPGTIYITGHRVAIFGPYHTAIEYDDGNGARWISAGPEGLGFEGAKYLAGGIGDGINGIRPTDMPALNILIGEVQPPSGVSSGDYFNQLVSAANAYNSSVDYDLFPGIANSYNSNSYVAGLIQATGGTSSVDLSGYVGGSKPLPKSNFGY